MAEGLSWFIPHHGRPKVTLRVPESHSLHICPPACGRRSGIRAIRNGSKGEVSFLSLTEADVSGGGYEDLVGRAVDTLLSVLRPAPRAFQLYVNCIDHFLGTDEEALVAGLEGRFPGVRFAVFHIDPVAADEAVSPGERQQDKLYTFLEDTGVRDGGVNLLGAFVSPHPEGELYPFLAACGAAPVRDLLTCRTFADYQAMGRSRLNLVLRHLGRYAARRLEERLGTPWVEAPACYDLEGIMALYRRISDALGVSCPDLSPWRAGAERAVDRARRAVGDRPVVVDSSASMAPFALAAALHRYGFCVRGVYAAHWKETDRADRAWLEAHVPDLTILCSERYGDALIRDIPRDCVAVGFDSAYLLQARHFVDIQRDEGLFGYHGLTRLMTLLEESVGRAARWEEMT